MRTVLRKLSTLFGGMIRISLVRMLLGRRVKIGGGGRGLRKILSSVVEGCLRGRGLEGRGGVRRKGSMNFRGDRWSALKMKGRDAGAWFRVNCQKMMVG
jgi:hypothetical protein